MPHWENHDEYERLRFIKPVTFGFKCHSCREAMCEWDPASETAGRLTFWTFFTIKRTPLLQTALSELSSIKEHNSLSMKKGTYTGSSMFRARITCSILSGRTLKINDIRESEEAPGLQDFEANYLRLIEKITNGSKIEINETGTSLLFVPGFICGGKIEHTCAPSRSVGWYLEGILGLAPFGKSPLTIILKGVTNDDLDFSVDTIKEVTIPLLKRFGLTEGISLRVVKRGAPPLGGGEVVFICPTLRSVSPIDFINVSLTKAVHMIKTDAVISVY
jgi:RNA 3'-terminal phosphate cyclase